MMRSKYFLCSAFKAMDASAQNIPSVLVEILFGNKGIGEDLSAEVSRIVLLSGEGILESEFE